MARALGGPGAPSQNERREPLWSVLGGAPGPPFGRFPEFCWLSGSRSARGWSGMWGSEGVAAGATVMAYVEAPLCAGGEAGAGERAAGKRGKSGSALPASLLLARASASIWRRWAPTPAGPPRTRPPSPTSNRLSPPSFSRPIVEAAGIACDPHQLRQNRDGPAPPRDHGSGRLQLAPGPGARDLELTRERSGAPQPNLPAVREGEGHPTPPSLTSKSFSASSRSGCLNSYPSSCVRCGITRCPPRSTFPNSPPNLRSRTKPGTGTTAGRPERPPQRLREVPVSRRVRRGGVDDAADLLVVERPEQDPDLVVDVDPGDVLLAAGERAADAELEGRSAARPSMPPLGVEDLAGADDRQPHAGRRRPRAPPLPLLHDLGVEALAAGPADSSTTASPRSP